MQRADLLLVQLGEEAAEVIQEVSKCLRFGVDEIYPPAGIPNIIRLRNELTDLFALVDMLFDEGLVKDVFDPVKIYDKKQKVEKHLEYSEECGRLV